MKNIIDFLDTCKERTNTTSDSNLARKIGLSRNAIHQYRTGRAIPSDEVVCILAKRADLDVDIALLWLNVWRAKGVAKEHYTDMLKRMTGLFLIVAFLAIPLNNKAFASPNPQISPSDNGTVYIMRNYTILCLRIDSYAYV